MSRDTQELLAECESAAQELVAEIDKYKQSVAYNKAVAKSLDGIGVSLENVLEKIAPYSEQKMDLHVLVTQLGLGLNALLLLLILIFK